MDYHIKQQIRALEGEKESVANSLSVQQITLAKRLKNGLGEAIVEELSNPIQPKEKNTIKYRLKKFFYNVKNIFK